MGTFAEHTLMHEGTTGMAALAWCDTIDCALTCNLLVPRTSVRRDGTTKAYLDYWDQKQLLTTFTETNLVRSQDVHCYSMEEWKPAVIEIVCLIADCCE